MHITKESRKALRQRLSQAIASVLAATPEADSEKMRKSVRKSAGKLAKKAIQPAGKVKKDTAPQPPVSTESTSPVASKGQAKPARSKKDKRKQKDKQAAVASMEGKRTAKPVS